MKKNHIIKSFRVTEKTYKLYKEAIANTGLSESDMRRLLFNRALHELIASSKLQGWDNLKFGIKEFE